MDSGGNALADGVLDDEGATQVAPPLIGAAAAEPLPEDVLAERFREQRLVEEDVRQRQVEGRAPDEAEPRS